MNFIEAQACTFDMTCFSMTTWPHSDTINIAYYLAMYLTWLTIQCIAKLINSVCLFVCLPAQPPAPPPTCLPACIMYVCMYIYLPVCLFAFFTYRKLEKVHVKKDQV